MGETMTGEYAAEKNIQKKPGFLNDLMDLVESIIFSIFIVTLIFTFLFRIATVDGPSMNNTLIDKDRLIITHLFYEPKYGDIVIINDENGYVYDTDGKTVLKTNGLNKKIVKRVIAISGQEINIDFAEQKVFVDGKELDEPYALYDNMQGVFNNEYAFQYPVTVPEGYVFVMGDNRNISRDSRDSKVGFVPVSEIMGKVVFRVYPFDSIGKIK